MKANAADKNDNETPNIKRLKIESNSTGSLQEPDDLEIIENQEHQPDDDVEYFSETQSEKIKEVNQID